MKLTGDFVGQITVLINMNFCDFDKNVNKWIRFSIDVRLHIEMDIISVTSNAFFDTN